MDPNLVTHGDLAPVDAGTKLGHHAHDHSHKKNDKDGNGIDDNIGIVNPSSYALKQAWKGLIKGATSLGLFTGVFIAVKSMIPAAMGTSIFGATLAPVLPALVAGALSGAIWYGGQAAYQAYQDANEHNQGFVKRVQDKVRLKQRMQGLGDIVPQFGIIGAADAPLASRDEMGDVAMIVPVVDADTLPNRETPAFVTAILDDGPRNARGAAAEIIADREAAAELETAR